MLQEGSAICLESNNMKSEELCKNLYSGSLWVRLFTSIRFWTSSFVELETIVPKSGTILDLGCGYGIFGNYLALSSSKRKVLGVDSDKNKIKNAYRGVENTSFKVGDATKMKLRNIDCILLLDVLHHLNSYHDQEELIKECREMLSKKGVLILSEVDSKPFWKLILGRLTDFFMYKGSRVLYRYKKDMLKVLKQNFPSITVNVLQNNPFPHVVYICQKK